MKSNSKLSLLILTLTLLIIGYEFLGSENKISESLDNSIIKTVNLTSWIVSKNKYNLYSDNSITKFVWQKVWFNDYNYNPDLSIIEENKYIYDFDEELKRDIFKKKHY